MKKHKIFFISLLSTSIIFSACQSSKNNVTASDTYNDSPDLEINAEGEEITSSPAASNTPVTPKKKNALEEFFTYGNRDDYIKYDESSVFVKEFGLKEKRATILVRPNDKKAGYGCYYGTVYYIVQFDETNRKKLAEAMEAYLQDFENKNLQRKGNHTERAYGKISYRLDWGTLSSSTPNHGEGSGYVGYEFIKGSPYFTISNYPFYNDAFDIIGDSVTRESHQLHYYFTKAQIKQLVELLSEDKINAQLVDNGYMRAPTEADEY